MRTSSYIASCESQHLVSTLAWTAYTWAFSSCFCPNLSLVIHSTAAQPCIMLDSNSVVELCNEPSIGLLLPGHSLCQTTAELTVELLSGLVRVGQTMCTLQVPYRAVGEDAENSSDVPLHAGGPQHDPTGSTLNWMQLWTDTGAHVMHSESCEFRYRLWYKCCLYDLLKVFFCILT